MMIYTKTPDKRKKVSAGSEPMSDSYGLEPGLVYHSHPHKVADHVTETLQILRCVLDGDYAAISKRLSTGQSMMSVREPGTGSSIAHLAARCGDKAILKLLLRKYSDYTKMSNNIGRTAVHEAAEHGKFVCLTYLLQHGALSKTRDRNGVTPLMLSAQKGHLQTLRRLALADPDTMMSHDVHGFTALHHAATEGQEAAVRWLVEFGADDTTKDAEGNSAMHHAVTNNHLKCAIWLQHFSSCDVRHINNRGYNSCHIAAEKGHLCMLHWLLSNQLVSPNEPGGKDGSTPVHVAAAHGQLESLRCLKMYGANMHKKNFNDKSPKDIAASNKNSDCVRYLDSIKKPKVEKHQKRANSLTRIVQALTISGSEDKSPKGTPKSGVKTKRKTKGELDRCVSDTESDSFPPTWAHNRPPPADLKFNIRRARAGSFNSNRSYDAPSFNSNRSYEEECNRSVYSTGSGSGISKPSWNQTINRGYSNGSEACSPASSSTSAGFDIMAVLRDEKRRQARLKSADQQDERSSVRSGGSYGNRGRTSSLLGSQDTIDRLPCSPGLHLTGYAPSPPPRSVSIDQNRSSANSTDFDMRLGSPQSPCHEIVSDRSSLALSDSSADSSRQFTFPRACPVHQPASPARINCNDFKKVFSERHAARRNTRCTCRSSTDFPADPRHLIASRSSNGSEFATSPVSNPPIATHVHAAHAGAATLRRRANELGRLDLDNFKANWGTKTLSPHTKTLAPGWNPGSHGANSGFPLAHGHSQQGFQKGWGTELIDKGPGSDEAKRAEGTTFRTSTNLSDICKL